MNRDRLKQAIKKLVKKICDEIERQKNDPRMTFIAITRGLIECQLGPMNKRDLDASWPIAMRECCLIDDGSGFNTYTLKGHSFYEALAAGKVSG